MSIEALDNSTNCISAKNICANYRTEGDKYNDAHLL